MSGMKLVNTCGYRLIKGIDRLIHGITRCIDCNNRQINWMFVARWLLFICGTIVIGQLRKAPEYHILEISSQLPAFVQGLRSKSVSCPLRSFAIGFINSLDQKYENMEHRKPTDVKSLGAEEPRCIGT